MIIYYYLAIFLFCVGFYGILIKKNLIAILFCIELMLCSVNLFFVLLSKNLGNVDGVVQTLFIIAMSVMKIAVGLGIIFSMYRKKMAPFLSRTQ